MRLFVALDISDEIRDRLSALLLELKQHAPAVKWVKPESLHLTLKFIGEQPEQRLDAVSEALAGVPGFPPLDLRFRGVGCFPNERRPRVYWVGVEAPPELARLAEAVDRALEPLRIQREQRAFSPHLTLGRAREGERIAALPPAFREHARDEFGRVTAREFHLYESRLSPAGAEYRRLRSFPLEN